MFDQTFVGATQSTKKPITVLLSMLMQLSAISILLLIPLVYTATLPGAVIKSLLVAPHPPVVRIPLVATAQPVHATRIFDAHGLTAPNVHPKQAMPINDSAAAPDVSAAATYDQANGPTGTLLLWPESSAPPPPPPAAGARPKSQSSAIRVGSGVAAANLITKVTPPYPSIAKAVGIQGLVEFQATISKEGNIENLQVLRGHPLLVKAATEAVLQWKYRPTLLNGQPVEVLTDIVVNFTLAR